MEARALSVVEGTVGVVNGFDDGGARGMVFDKVAELGLGRVTDPPPHPLELFSTGIASIDLALAGGLTEATTYFMPGPPGAGKSTLALQVADGVASRGTGALYISTEKSKVYVQREALRLGLSPHLAYGGADTHKDIADILSTARNLALPLLVVDSLQDATRRRSSKAAMLRGVEVMSDLREFAQASGAAVLIVGHVTKEGDYEGSRRLEHDCDVFMPLLWDQVNPVRELSVRKSKVGPAGSSSFFMLGAAGIETVDGFLETLTDTQGVLPPFQSGEDVE